MNLALLVYLASISEGFIKLLGVAGTLGLIIVFFLLFMLFCGEMKSLTIRRKQYSCDDEAEIEQHNLGVPARLKVFKRSTAIVAVVSSILLLFAVLIPSEKTIYIMAGAYATEQIVTNTKVQKIGNDVLEVIESKLDKMKDKE